MSAWQTQQSAGGARPQTGAAARSRTSPAHLPEESACALQQASCPVSIWLAESRKGFPLTSPKPFSSLPSPGSTEPVVQQIPYSFLAFAWQTSQLPPVRAAKPILFLSWGGHSSSSLEGRAASLPTQIITRAAFSARLAGNFRLNGTKAKVYRPKLSKSSILPNHFSIPGLQLVSHCQGSSRRVYPTSLQPAGSRGHHTITDVIYTLPSCSRVNL